VSGSTASVPGPKLSSAPAARQRTRSSAVGEAFDELGDGGQRPVADPPQGAGGAGSRERIRIV
jgi:hypothetical protein